ncbi:hypothetical protein Tco_0095936, partial [Tanacetum coccineum]
MDSCRFGEGVVIFCLRVYFSPIAYSLSYFDSFDIPSDLLSVLMTPLIFTDIPFDLIFAIKILLILLFVSSHGGTMTMSLMHQWHDTICGGVISLRWIVWMHP